MGNDTSSEAGNDRASAAVVQELQTLQQDLGMRTRLTELSISPDDVPLLTTEAWKQRRLLPNNIREVAVEDIRAIYTEAL